jgi:hypothetical protein
MKKSFIKNSRSGQTVIEFALVSVIFIFMLVVTFNAILAFGTQQYLSYATFMAARAYQAGAKDETTASGAAANVLKRFIPGIELPQSGGRADFGGEGYPVVFATFGMRPIAHIKRVLIPRVRTGDYASALGIDQDANALRPQDPTKEASLPKAVQIDFTVPFATLPLGAEVRARLGEIPMFAQSFLGRQVSREECQLFFRNFISKFQISGVSNFELFSGPGGYYRYMDDNGC